jgi:hypothetical protein
MQNHLPWLVLLILTSPAADVDTTDLSGGALILQSVPTSEATHLCDLYNHGVYGVHSREEQAVRLDAQDVLSALHLVLAAWTEEKE